jgi:hypothetical protein
LWVHNVCYIEHIVHARLLQAFISWCFLREVIHRILLLVC